MRKKLGPPTACAVHDDETKREINVTFPQGGSLVFTADSNPQSVSQEAHFPPTFTGLTHAEASAIAYAAGSAASLPKDHGDVLGQQGVRHREPRHADHRQRHRAGLQHALLRNTQIKYARPMAGWTSVPDTHRASKFSLGFQPRFPGRSGPGRRPLAFPHVGIAVAITGGRDKK